MEFSFKSCGETIISRDWRNMDRGRERRSNITSTFCNVILFLNWEIRERERERVAMHPTCKGPTKIDLTSGMTYIDHIYYWDAHSFPIKLY